MVDQRSRAGRSSRPPGLVVYDDVVHAPWLDFSWGVTNDPASTAETYAGATAFRSTGAGAVAMRHGPWNGGIDISPADYEAFSFAVHPGSEALELTVGLGNDSAGWYSIFDYGVVPADQWTVVEIPLADLDPQALTIHYFFIGSSGDANTVMHLDEIHFTDPGGVPADTTPPDLSVVHAPTVPTDSQSVTFTATASDASGIAEVSITVDGGIVATCPTSPCTFVGGPYGGGTAHSYSASAIDASPNSNVSVSPVSDVHEFDVAPPGPGPAAGVIGYEIVSALSLHSTSTVKRLDAFCPSGKQVIGGGVYGAGESGVPFLSAPNHRGIEIDGVLQWDTWSGGVKNDSGENWRIHVVAICAFVQ